MNIARSGTKVAAWIRYGALVAVACLTACSGGGSAAAPTPQTSDPYGGLGVKPTFDQKVNFTIVVPPPAVVQAALRQRRRAGSSTVRKSQSVSASPNPYVSPNVASVSFQVVEVDGQSVRTLPAPFVANVSCGTGAAGCSVPVQGVPAAKGSDQFSIETFSGPNGSGNLVSTSALTIAVPSPQAVSFGGTTLSVGGLVRSLALSVNAPGGTFRYNTASTGSLAVNAVDPAGAVIIGTAILQTPITVAFPANDLGDFAFAGSTSAVLPAPATVALSYNGTPVQGAQVSASTTDFAGNALATTVPLPVAPAPTATPTLPPAMKPALSLYVLDGMNFRMIEYSGINALEGGGVVTVRRAFDIIEPNNATYTCSSSTIPGFAVRSDGTIYVQSNCVDTATGTINYVFVYAPGTVEASSGGVATAPQPTAIVPVPVNSYQANAWGGIKLDETANEIVLQYAGIGNSNSRIIGLSLSNPTTVVSDTGDQCIGYVGSTAPCNASGANIFSGATLLNFALDGLGGVLAPNNESNPPPQPVSQQYGTENAIVRLPEGQTSTNPVANAVLAGYTTDLNGPFNNDLVEVATEGSSLYAFVQAGSGAGPIAQPVTGNMVYPGLSGCPPSNSSGVAMANSQTLSCSSGSPVSYLAGFKNILPSLATSGALGMDFSPAPTFMLGGDTYGDFDGNIGMPGDDLTVKDGYLYLIDLQPTQAGIPTGSPEIKVFNTANLGIYTTGPESQPFETIPFPAMLAGVYAVQPTSIQIGPTGPVAGGTSILAKTPAHHVTLRAMQQRARVLRARFRHR